MSRILKKIEGVVLILGLSFLLSGCEKGKVGNISVTSLSQNDKPTAFDLVFPISGEEVTSIPSFKWQESANSTSYTLEVCSSEGFSQKDDDVYIKKTGIFAESFSLFSDLGEKEKTYYWRITAVNEKGSRLCESQYGSFYYAADTEEEIPFTIDNEDDWVVHEEGSFAAVSVDSSDFFQNGQNALKISFVSEDTKRGVDSSDGWIVVTDGCEKELYSVDAFYFNFYYSGQDAEVFLRVIDADNEYWHAQIKLANNAKQTVIIGFDEFELRTKGGTTIANQKFDYNHIKGVELVFEHSFGDGVCYFSDLKAVSLEKYKHLYIRDFNFDDLNEEYIYEAYNFATGKKGNEISLSFSNKPDDANAKGINGYGFCKIPVNKLLSQGDAFSIHLEAEGMPKTGYILIRLIEEDGDRWVYKHPASDVGRDLIIPFSAFTLSEYHGDGSRQFYYIKQLQLGVSDTYSTGSVSFSDLKVVSLSEAIIGYHQTTISENGMIEDFEKYINPAELYYSWETSVSNKDEAVYADSLYAVGEGNTKYGRFMYKADMGSAEYGVHFNGIEGFNSISFMTRDDSVKAEEAVYNYLKDVSAKMIISVYLSTGETYRNVIDEVPKYWTQYVMNFKDFVLDEGFFGEVHPITSENIAGISFGFQYYYYDQDGKPFPKYASNNAVLMDDISLAVSQDSYSKEVVRRIVPDSKDPQICVIDDFEGYSDGKLSDTWKYGRDYAYNELKIVEDGRGHCLSMKYKGNSDSVSYVIAPNFDETVTGKALRFKLKGDGKATVYVNIYFTYAGQDYQYRATLKNVSEEWKEYVLGFDNFSLVSGTGSVTLNKDKVKDINKITFGIVNYSDYNNSFIFLDDLKTDASVSYSTKQIKTVED